VTALRDERASRAQGLASLARARRDAVLAFARDLVRIESPSGSEEAAARRTVEEMRALGLDEADLDEAGNAVGVLRARRGAPLSGALLFDSHLDVVDAGDSSGWTHGPFSGVVAGGRLHGRGATDAKSAVAGMVHAAGLLASSSLELSRDLVVAAVVQEEVGGLGTACLLESGRRFHAAVIGEPSLGALAFGHRGRVELEVSFRGKAAHASRPDWGVNPHASLARFVSSLESVECGHDPRFGRSSVSPTTIRAEPASPNVIPETVTLTLDWRHVPGEEPAAVEARIARLAEAAALPGVQASVRLPLRPLTSWKGARRDVPRISRGFAVEPDAAPFATVRRCLAAGLGREVAAIGWDFASDGGWLAAAGTTCVGYGPGDMELMHCREESVSVDALAESVAAYAILALALDGPGAPA